MNSGQHLCVRNVLAIPRQQILYPMMGCRCDVKRIDLRFCRENGSRHYFIGNLSDFRRVGQSGDTIQCKQTIRRKYRVTGRGLVDHILRYDKLIFDSLVVPSPMSQYLVCRHHNLRTWTLPQVTDNRCFYVHGIHTRDFSVTVVNR
jgi:hypothetical protein